MKEEKKGFIAWMKKHRKELIVTGISSITAMILVILGIKNKEAIKELWDSLEESIAKAPVISSDEVTAPATVQIADVPLQEPILATRAYTSSQSQFDVDGCIRNLPEGWHPSDKKIAEAASRGIELMPNQTLVDPYVKGKDAA